MSYRALLRRLLDGSVPPAPPAPQVARPGFPLMRVHRGEAEMSVGAALLGIARTPVATLSPAEVERCFGIPQVVA